MRRSPIQSHVAMESAPASLPNMSGEGSVRFGICDGRRGSKTAG